jgi:hypothetical protein
MGVALGRVFLVDRARLGIRLKDFRVPQRAAVFSIKAERVEGGVAAV